MPSKIQDPGCPILDRQSYRRAGWGKWRHGFASRRLTTLLTLLLTITLLAAAPTPEARLNKLGHEMVCQCGCSQILLECNHVGCPVSPVMISELQTRIAAGGPDNLIFNWFIAKYGAIVLAAPIRGGFDDVAWITPIAVFLLATIGVAFLVTLWKKRNPPPPPPSSGTFSDTLMDQIRQETQY
jgi:cytochrome c-type biogenesis protein CcmH/NrfF